ncbi:MAG: cytochrome P450 [Oligoflexus sp.]
MSQTARTKPKADLQDYYRQKNNQALTHIPGPEAWPVIGNTLQFLRDPVGFNIKLLDDFAGVYKLNLFFRDVVALIGPDANQLVLLDRRSNFSSKMGWNDRLGRLFTDGLMLRDFSDHRLHKRIMSKSFGSKAMENYADIMNQTIAESLNAWDDLAGLEFYNSFKEITLNIAATAFVGISPGAEAAKLNKAFVDSVSAGISILRLAIPGLKFKRGLAGREYLISYLRGLLPQKRAKETRDMFSQFCHCKTPEGESFSDDDVINHMIFLLMAAHDTITSSVTSLVYFLASTPDWQDAVREEGAGIGPGPLDYADLDKLPLLEACFNEALRLYPPVPMIPRRSVEGFDFQDIEIPARTMIYVNPFLTHRLPEYWSEPFRYDPTRFLERQEHQQHPYLFVPFGGGAHMCIGRLFAYMEMKLFMHQLLQRYQLKLPDNYVLNSHIVPIPKPKGGLPIQLTKVS